MTTFVLVHGAWHGAWCWKYVLPELERLGRRAEAPDLPGLGDDPAPPVNITLDDYISRIRDIVHQQSGPVILVGHSMAGMVITGVAEQIPDRIRMLVYLAAFLPRDGETLLGLEERNADPRVPPNVIAHKEENSATLNPAAVHDLFYHDCSGEDAKYAASRLRKQAFLPLTAPVHTTPENFGRVPRTYIECLDDRALVIDFQREMHRAAGCDRVLSMNTGHSPFLSAPVELAGLLSGLAEDVA